jgi:clan AA aspartic protease (TIGR02281 family)
MREKYSVESKDAPPPVVHIPKDQNHFTVYALINDHIIPMLVDTGATTTALTQTTARKIGIPVSTLDYSIKVHTANGTTLSALAVLDQISIDSIVEKKLPVLVEKDCTMNTDLLGMNFLDRLASWEVLNGHLILRGKSQQPPQPTEQPPKTKGPHTRAMGPTEADDRIAPTQQPSSKTPAPNMPSSSRDREITPVQSPSDPSAPAYWGQPKK